MILDEVKKEEAAAPSDNVQRQELAANATPTVYVQNLNEKVPLAELKEYLFQLFSNLGINVLEVKAKKNIRMRGQAFIVCGDE